jgi:ubiquinone/menaquinone biosynthesis C-methylase UbiE
MSRQGTRFSADKTESMARIWSKYYDRLADHFLTRVRVKPSAVILEAGCGKGQLTIPLIKKLPKSVKLIAVDSSTGPYLGWLDQLATKILRLGLEKRVHLLRSDVRTIRGVEDSSVDLIVSNELLCDLPRRDQLSKALNEFYRILRPGGSMIHGEWYSSPVDHGRGFKVKHTPAWNPDQLFNFTKDAGFHNLRVSYFDATVNFGYDTAIPELRTWGVTESFFKHYEKSLKRYGIQIPYEHVVQCEK